jgi:hypothetical protein
MPRTSASFLGTVCLFTLLAEPMAAQPQRTDDHGDPLPLEPSAGWAPPVSAMFFGTAVEPPTSPFPPTARRSSPVETLVVGAPGRGSLHGLDQ